ncbi:hypothetical protein [Streptomyces collinus]|uniref:hypothetical protein n=1 Tax=Streptomyces collinus TaxID=42684 RepID=UPI0036F0D287
MSLQDETASRIERKVGRTLLTALAISSVVAGGVSTAYASVPGDKGVRNTGSINLSQKVPNGFSSWADVFEIQNHLDDAASRVRDSIKNPDLSGFTAIEVSPETKELQVFWKGEAPRDLTQLAALPAGYTLKITPSDFSSAELEAAVDDYVANAKKAGLSFSSVSPKNDYSGISVTAPNSSALVAAHGVAIRNGVPVSFSLQDNVTPTANRLNDVSPYYAGAWYGVPGANCTTAFAVSVGGKSKLLTAGHCAENGDETTIHNESLNKYVHMGWFEKDLLPKNPPSPAYDLAMIDVPDSAGYAWLGQGDSGDTSVPIEDARDVNIGDYICTNGAMSLQINCNAKVTKINATVNENGFGVVSKTAFATELSGNELTRSGDSGSQIATLKTLGSQSAQGILAGGLNAVPCYPGGPVDTHCMSTVVFTPVKTALSLYGATLKTASP